MQYVIATDGTEEDALELPTEQDGCVLMSTLSAQFPDAIGLKFKPPGKTVFRALKVENAKIWPDVMEGWGDHVYTVVFPKAEVMNGKRKMNQAGLEHEGSAKMKRGVDQKRTSDLIVLGLPFSLTSDELRQYFLQFGELVIAEIKAEPSGKSKGFGFIRFADYTSQLKVLGKSHKIENRICDVRIPNSQLDNPNQPSSQRVFVGRVPDSLTSERMREYFGEFGEVTDVYLPKPNRGFAFVTFFDPDVAERLIGEDLVIDGSSVRVGEASPKSQDADHARGGGARGGRGGISHGMDSLNLGGGGGQDNSNLQATLLGLLAQASGGGGGGDYSTILNALRQLEGGGGAGGGGYPGGNAGGVRGKAGGRSGPYSSSSRGGGTPTSGTYDQSWQQGSTSAGYGTYGGGYMGGQQQYW